MTKLNDAFENMKETAKVMNNYIFEDLSSTNAIRESIGKTPVNDTRYNTPKGEPKSSQAAIDKTIMETEIYRRAKMQIMNAQRRQIGYGLDKYPEPLNANTWSTIETIDHIIEESIDKLHYLVMLRIKLEQELISSQTISEQLINAQRKRRDDYLDQIKYVQDIHPIGNIKTSVAETPIMKFKNSDVKDVLYADNQPIGWVGHDGNIHLGKFPPGADMDGDISSFIFADNVSGPVGHMQTPTGISLGNDGNDNE